MSDISEFEPFSASDSDDSYHVDLEDSETDVDVSKPSTSHVKRKKINSRQHRANKVHKNKAGVCNYEEILKGIEEADKKLIVSAVEKKFDKRTSCIYCKELVLKLPRHFIRKHKNEKEVKEFCSYPAKDPKRLSIIENLRKQGNFQHNKQTYEEKNGNLIVTRRPRTESSSNNYLPCPLCLGFYSRRTLYLHSRRCKQKKQTNFDQSRVQKAGRALLPMDTEACDILKTRVLPHLKNDYISEIVKTDKLILQFGSDLALKLCKDQHLSNHIRQRMRELGRLVYELTAIDKTITQLQDIFHASKANLFFKALSNLAELNIENGSFGKPSTALKLRTSIHTCAEILLALAVPDEHKINEIQQFLSVINLKFKRYCALALQTIDSLKWNKPVKLPESEEIKLFCDYLDKEEKTLFKKLSKRYTYDIWNKLSKVVLCNILVFNRRRAGESQMIKITEFEKRHTIEEDSDLYRMLSESEKQVCNNYYRIQVRGKLRNGVPVLISKFQIEIIELILKYRFKAGVHHKNPFVFGRLNNSFIRATDAIRLLAVESGVKNPEIIRSTALRKQLSTQVQVLNLKKNEMDDLANSLGHDIRIHRSYYRLPDHMVQIAKTGKILLAAKQNLILKNQGRGLDDIQIFKSGYLKPGQEDSKMNWETAVSESIEECVPSTSDSCNISYTSSEDQLNSENQSIPEVGNEESLESVNSLFPVAHNSEDILDTFVTASAVDEDSEDEPILNRLRKSLATRSDDESSCNNVLSKDKVASEDELTISERQKKAGKPNETSKKRRKDESNEEDEQISGTSDEEKKICKKKLKKGTTRWITPEKNVLRNKFESHLKNMTVPGKQECMKVLDMSPLKRRSWRDIKNWVHNTNTSLKKRLAK